MVLTAQCMQCMSTLGSLAYADDITISCPSRRGLNRLLYICHSFALSNNITFNTKKTMCIKYGEPVKDSEMITLDQVQLKYYETVRHLGNFFNTDNNCTSDINYKCSSFIGYFNKMVQHDILGARVHVNTVIIGF